MRELLLGVTDFASLCERSTSTFSTWSRYDKMDCSLLSDSAPEPASAPLLCFRGGGRGSREGGTSSSRRRVSMMSSYVDVVADLEGRAGWMGGADWMGGGGDSLVGGGACFTLPAWEGGREGERVRE